MGALIPDALSYTLEVSFFHSSPDAVTVAVPGQPPAPPVSFTNTIEGLLDMGKQLALAIHELYNLGAAVASGGGALATYQVHGSSSAGGGGGGGAQVAGSSAGGAVALVGVVDQPLGSSGADAPL